MIQIKDYAEKKHVTYEAVRKQIKRYEADLEGHIIRKGNVQFLDDEAEKFLDGKRATNPVIVYEHDKDVQIEQLQNENANLKTALAEAEHKRADALDLLSKERELRIEEHKQMLAIEQKSDDDKKRMDEVIESNRQMVELVQQKDEERQRITEQHEAEKKQAEEEKQLLAQQLEAEKQQRESEKEENQRVVQQLEEELQSLKNRGFWARLFNK